MNLTTSTRFDSRLHYTAEQRELAGLLMEDFGWSFEEATRELDHNDWDYGVTYRAVRASMPDL